MEGEPKGNTSATRGATLHLVNRGATVAPRISGTHRSPGVPFRSRAAGRAKVGLCRALRTRLTPELSHPCGPERPVQFFRSLAALRSLSRSATFTP